MRGIALPPLHSRSHALRGNAPHLRAGKLGFLNSFPCSAWERPLGSAPLFSSTRSHAPAWERPPPQGGKARVTTRSVVTRMKSALHRRSSLLHACPRISVLSRSHAPLLFSFPCSCVGTASTSGRESSGHHAERGNQEEGRSAPALLSPACVPAYLCPFSFPRSSLVLVPMLLRGSIPAGASPSFSFPCSCVGTASTSGRESSGHHAERGNQDKGRSAPALLSPTCVPAYLCPFSFPCSCVGTASTSGRESLGYHAPRGNQEEGRYAPLLPLRRNRQRPLDPSKISCT
jgi:hypothetical protein